MKMRISLCKFLLLIGLPVVLVSCGGYGALLKTNDHERIYQTALQQFQEKKNEKAIALFDAIDYYYAGTAREDTIKFYTALSHFRRGDYFTANELLQTYQRTFGRSPFIEEADYLIALGYYLLSPEPELDQTPSKMAILQFNEYLARYPNSVKRDDIYDMLAELHQKLYDKSFLNAKLYYDIGYYKSAIHTFKLALAEYPESTRREEMMYLLTKASFILADNSVESLQRGRYLDMIDNYYNLISDYPETRYLKEVRDMYDKVQMALHDRYDEAIENPLEQQPVTE